MDRLPDVYALTDFRQNTAQHLTRLKKSERPTVLTQNGRTAAVVLSEAMYNRLAKDAAFGRSVAGLQHSLQDSRPDIPFARAAARLRAKYSRRQRPRRRS